MFYIYRITNNVNGKTYIGQRKCPKNKTPLEDTYIGSGKLIKQAIKKYGVENFTKTIIGRFFTREMTNFAELYYIKKEMQRGEDCYNLLVGAHWLKGHTSWMKGRKTPDEVKAKISASEKGRVMGDDVRIKISNTLKGRKRPEFSEEWKRKLSKAHKGKQGRKLSEETKRKISEAHKGKKLSEEVKAKKSAAFKGKHWKLVDGKRVWY